MPALAKDVLTLCSVKSSSVQTSRRMPEVIALGQHPAAVLNGETPKCVDDVVLDDTEHAHPAPE